MNEEQLRRKLEREKLARLQAEKILEQKSQELSEKNDDLSRLSQNLEKVIMLRTREFQKVRDEALSAAQAKSEFLANMSHEIRTPLNGIMGMLTMLEETAMTSNQGQLVHTALQSAKHLVEIVNDILDFSKIDAGQMEIHDEVTHFSTLLDEVFGPISLSGKQKVRFSSTVPATFPPYIFVDALRLRQVLHNLLSNAVKFTAQGNIRLVVEQEEQFFSITVADSGIGMDEEQMAKIFQAFGQADGSITRRFGGTGLGLTITQRLVQMMGGELSVRSEPGKGSAFTARLPLRAVSRDDSDSQPDLQKISEQTRFDGQKVLLVEDNPVNQTVASHLLNKASLSFDIANNGSEAISLLEQDNSYVLVLMDIQMPVMDGLEATRRIRSSDTSYSRIPVIAMTAHATREHRETSAQAGMNQHVTKPIDPKALYRAIAHFIPPHSESEADSGITEPELALPEALEYLSVKDALERIGHNTELYFRLLAMFLDKHRDFVADIRHRLEKQDPFSVQMILHTIKGSAANIGADPLSQIASAYEDSFKSGQTSDPEAMCQDLQACWNQTAADISSILAQQPENDENRENIDEAQTYARLKEISRYLSRDIAQVESQIEELKKCQYPDQFGALIGELSDAVALFNIPQARVLLDDFFAGEKHD